jgi:spore maturation protein CgeB
MFTHSLISDWNHGNAHFQRGIAAELIARGHKVRIFEPRNGWSLRNLLETHGLDAVRGFHRAFPYLHSIRYDLAKLDLDRVLEGAGMVIVHEWNSPELVKRIGLHHARRNSYRLFFHDTHHRSVTDPAAMGDYDLRHYDGVLAYGRAIRDIYREKRWARACWTWHEAADTRLFRPRPLVPKRGDVVWIGNWGDGERAAEIREFLIEPVRALGLKASVYGVRYPEQAIAELRAAGIEYGGWLPNYRVPDTFAQFRVTVHIPRQPYVCSLPGIPTIRPFEAMACGIPLVSAPWDDCEQLFRPGRDFLFARDRREMTTQLHAVLNNPGLSRRLAESGMATIRARHTCSHRADELLSIASMAWREGAA